MRLARLAAASAAFTIAVGGFAAPSFADPPVKSNLLASPTAVSVNVWSDPSAVPPHTATVNVHLDDYCAQATDATKYTIAAGSTGGYFTVSPAISDPLDCTQSANFTITGVSVPLASPLTLHFSPIGKNQGVQKKLGNGVDVQVTVVDTTPNGGPPPCTSATNCPVPGANPAAPAVANALLNMNPQLAQACKAKLNNAKNWRGQVISTIAGTMPKPESIKDTMSNEDWVAFVKNGSSDFPNFQNLYKICGYTEPIV